MTYKPTGKPPGRPRKDGEPAGSVPKHARDEAPDAPGRHELHVVVGQYVPFEMGPCCPVCHPDGWPAGWTGYGCQHGIWARRI